MLRYCQSKQKTSTRLDLFVKLSFILIKKKHVPKLTARYQAILINLKTEENENCAGLLKMSLNPQNQRTF
jgi:hypothetical protein